jgi:hypothetical protein
MSNIKKVIAYPAAWVNFQLGRFMSWLMFHNVWEENPIADLYVRFMYCASEWQDWGGINYPWKEDKNK